ncbi:MAG: ferrous iron transport protein A [Ignavibacteria bacterium]|nr:ferrous iron transport protein A [Ignavibacteria bacterium]
MHFTLDKAEPGEKLIIQELPNGEIKSQLIRLGITQGEKINCLERLVGGTVVIQKKRQEIALGYELARKISVIHEN